MFTSVSARSAAAYKIASIDASVEMADSHQLISLLFDALQQQLGAARLHMANRDVAKKCKSVNTALRILEEGLIAALDMENGGEVAGNLRALYDYCARQLILANAKNDVAGLQEISNLIEPVASGWKQIKGKGQPYLQPV